jgi:hypothetical protein
MKTRKAIDDFAKGHPDFDALSHRIVSMVAMGLNLEQAYYFARAFQTLGWEIDDPR